MDNKDPRCFINQPLRRHGKDRSRLALMTALLFSTAESAAAPVPALNEIGDSPDAECAEPFQVQGSDNRGQLSKKRHKKKVIHQNVKKQPTGKMAAFFERVTDPRKAEREAMMEKDPFGRMEGRW